MAIADDAVIRRIDVEPAGIPSPGCQPGVRRIGADERRRRGGIGRGRCVAEIAAHVARREVERSEAGDLEMGEVLADAALVHEHVLDRRRGGRGGRVVDEIPMDPPREVDDPLGPGPPWRKRGACIVRQLRQRAHERGDADELDRRRRGSGAVADLLPGDPRQRLPGRGSGDGDSARRGDCQTEVHLTDREHRHMIAEPIDPRGARGGRGVDGKGVEQDLLVGRVAGAEMDLVVAHRHLLRIGVDRRVHDLVDRRGGAVLRSLGIDVDHAGTPPGGGPAQARA